MHAPEPRHLNDWLWKPSVEESICNNPFHAVMCKVLSGYTASPMDPFWEEDSPFTKLAKLVKAELILPEGDVIYVRERDNLIPLGEAIGLLAYYMHVDRHDARKAADVLETNFQGYFPITGDKVWRGGISLEYPNTTVKGGPPNRVLIDLATMEAEKPGIVPGIPEFGVHTVTSATTDVLWKFFNLINTAVGEDHFFEKALMYPFNQRIREKSHVLVGKGGNGKSLFMRMVQRLYGDRAYTDAPQPNFRGHDPAVIAYNFVGKRVVTFNDVGDPSEAFLEWLKRMITGNLEVKTPSGAWLSVPCVTNFMLETNHAPAVLDIEAHARRYVIRTFDEGFKLNEHMTEVELDMIGERGSITAGDLVNYLMHVKPDITDWKTFTAPVVQEMPVAAADY
jgi:hypothetical protein